MQHIRAHRDHVITDLPAVDENVLFTGSVWRCVTCDVLVMDPDAVIPGSTVDPKFATLSEPPLISPVADIFDICVKRRHPRRARRGYVSIDLDKV